MTGESAKYVSDSKLTLGFVTTSRADSGIYRPLLRKAMSDGHRVVVYAGGTHFIQRYGMTGQSFGEFNSDEFGGVDGLQIVRVDHQVNPADGSDSNVVISAGRALLGFGTAISSPKLDMLFVLGDRSEMLAATIPAHIQRIPIAHIHGGEETRGAYDDAFRNAITQLATLHFPALPRYAERIASMGIAQDRIHCVGALGIDAIAQRKTVNDDELQNTTGLDFSHPTYVVLFHPETLADIDAAKQVAIVVESLSQVLGQMLILGVNADVGSADVRSGLTQFVESRKNAVMIASLPPDQYYACLERAMCLIGNSSSGIIEAVALKCPVVNIGDRQAGRFRTANVIDVSFEIDQIVQAIERAESDVFRSLIANIETPYGDGRAAERIMSAVTKFLKSK